MFLNSYNPVLERSWVEESEEQTVKKNKYENNEEVYSVSAVEENYKSFKQDFPYAVSYTHLLFELNEYPKFQQGFINTCSTKAINKMSFLFHKTTIMFLGTEGACLKFVLWKMVRVAIALNVALIWHFCSKPRFHLTICPWISKALFVFTNERHIKARSLQLAGLSSVVNCWRKNKKTSIWYRRNNQQLSTTSKYNTRMRDHASLPQYSFETFITKWWRSKINIKKEFGR